MLAPLCCLWMLFGQAYQSALGLQAKELCLSPGRIQHLESPHKARGNRAAPTLSVGQSIRKGEEGRLIKMWGIPICAVLRKRERERPQSCSSATALEWGPPRATCLLCPGPLSTSKLGYGEPWGCCLRVIQIKDLSRGCCGCQLVHVPPSSVSFPRS